jgi:hypothetical protein
LVKGTLLGATNEKSNKIRPSISKNKFLESFNYLHKNDLNYKNAKLINENYNIALKCFLSVYSDWLRTDPDKFYDFKIV